MASHTTPNEATTMIPHDDLLISPGRPWPSLATQKITQRYKPCICGCKGADPWHRATLTRTVAGIVLVAGDGGALGSPERDARWGLPSRYVVARGLIRVPWTSDTGKAEVIAVRRRFVDGTWSRYVDWELATLKR